MADSVGKIQLDLEITPNSIAQQISAVSRAFASGMQRSFSQMKNFTRGTFSDMARQMRSVVSRETPVPDDTTMKIESLVEQMENASNQADHFRQKLKDLQNSYNQLTAREKQGTFGQKLREEILRTEERMLRYGEKSDKLRMEIEKLEQSTRQLERSTGRTGRATERASRGFTRVGESARRAQGPVTGFANTLHRALMRVLRQVFIFAVLYKAIRGMIEYTGAALKTNQAFMHSLNQVKTNLQVAFMPIYQAILPALNTLMAWLAKATAYIASFVSALFGKTYKQSFQAAKGLEAAKKSLEGTGKAAKKAAGSLAPFDELNILSEPDDGDGGDDGSSGLVAPSVDTSAIDSEMQTLADRVKSVFATLWQPFKAAWENEGANTISAAKYALGGIWELVKEIGKSFAIVWTGGTGQAILETFLRILQQILGLIGDIGFTFANAWAESGRGTAIIQGIANVFSHLLELVEHIGESLRNVWGEIGPTVAAVFLDIINATVDVLENLAEKLLYVWDHGGQRLFESLVKLGAKILQIAGEIYTGFVAPFVTWFVDMIAPVVASILDSLAPLLDKLAEKLLYVWNNGGKVLFENLVRVIKAIISIALPFIELIITKVLAPLVIWILDKIAPALSWLLDKVGWILGKIAGFFEWLYDTLVGHSIIPDLINAIKTWFENLVGWVTAPVKKLVDGVVNFCQQLYDKAKAIFNEVKNIITTIFNTVKTTALNIWNSIKNTLSGVWNGLKTTATTIFNGVKNAITGAFNTVKTTVLNIWNTIVSKVTGAFNTIYSKAKDIFGKIKSFISGVCNSVKSFFHNMVNGVIRALNGMIGGLNKLKFNVPSWVPGLGGKKFGFNLQEIPYLARGGIVDQPTLAMIGEKRKKEAVVPLEDTSFVDKLAEAVANAVLAAMQFSGGQEPSTSESKELIIEIDGVKLARVLLPKTNAELRRRGAKPILQPV